MIASAKEIDALNITLFNSCINFTNVHLCNYCTKIFVIVVNTCVCRRSVEKHLSYPYPILSYPILSYPILSDNRTYLTSSGINVRVISSFFFRFSFSLNNFSKTTKAINSRNLESYLGRAHRTTP